MPTIIIFDQFQEVLFKIYSLVFFVNRSHLELFILLSIDCFDCNFLYQLQFSGYDWLGCKC